MKLILGEGADVLTSSIKAVPKRILDYDYKFQKPRIEDALKDLLKDREKFS